MKTDVAILGGGLAGLTLAFSVRRSNLDASVTVVAGPEKKVSSYKLGESLVELSYDSAIGRLEFVG